jgi:sulfide:quinone oxidoreductase
MSMMTQAITQSFSICGQIRPEDLASIAQAGFKSVICNRPDGEAADQPSFAQIGEAARAAGLQVRHLPVVPGQITEAHAREMASLRAQLPAPVLAFCRTGARSTSLWQLSQSVSGAA